MKGTTWLLVIVVVLIVLYALARPKLAQAQPAGMAAPAHPLPLGLANEAKGVAATVNTFADLLKGFKSPFAGQGYTPAQIQKAEAPTLTVTPTGGVTFFG